jgi:hypothetical protein
MSFNDARQRADLKRALESGSSMPSGLWSEFSQSSASISGELSHSRTCLDGKSSDGRAGYAAVLAVVAGS